MPSYRVLAAGLLAAAFLAAAPAQAETAKPAPVLRDGQHDFDFNFGTWHTHIKRLLHPLTGSTEWVEMDGTVTVSKIWGGRAQIEEVEADGPQGHFQDIAIFLYNPDSHQWTMNFANSRSGELSGASTGEFKDGRGELYSAETVNGRAALARIVWSDITANEHHFEQSFSADGGKTWEPNFVATVTRKAS
jgi:hypothetical protein